VVERFKRLFSGGSDNLQQVAFLLAVSALFSQILALVRDKIFAHLFGTGPTLDVYYAAFKVPDFLFVTIASLVSMTVLIPYFTREYAKDKEGARIFLDSVFTVFFWLLIASALISYFMIPKLAGLVTPGFSVAQRLEYIHLSRILLLSPFFLGLSGHIASISQSFKKFFAYALSPVLYNVGIIVGALLLYSRMGSAGLAWGVILGAFLHFAIQWPTVSRTGYAPHLISRIAWARVREVFIVSIPRTITLGTAQLSGLVLTSLASLLAVGSITVYNFSLNLQSVPLSIIGVSFSMAAFPTLSALFSAGENNKFSNQMKQAAGQIIFWSLPVTALFIVLRAQIVRVILGSGNFDWTATRLVAASLALFAISLVAQCLVLLFVRGYYASGSTKTPLYSNVISAICIVLFAPLLVYVYRHFDTFKFFINFLLRVDDVPGTEVLMLPLAYTLGLFINLYLHWSHFARKFGFLSLRDRVVRHSFFSAVLSGFVAYEALNFFDKLVDINTLPGIFLQGLLAGILGILSGFFLLVILKNEELRAIISALRGRFWSVRPILPPPEEKPQL